MCIKTIYIIFFTALSPVVFGQEVLKKYIVTGLRNNRQLLINQLNIRVAEEELHQVKGNFMPDIYLDASYSWAKGGRTINVPAGDLINPAYHGLNQLLGENRYPTNIPNTKEQFLPDDFHETKIRVIQPLLNSRIYYQNKAQKAQISVFEARRQAYELQLVKEIKVAYYKHLAANEQLTLYNHIHDLLEDLLRINKSLVTNGKATVNVVYDIQAELAQVDAEIASAIKHVNISRNYFNYLIGQELETSILTDSVILSDAVGRYENLMKEGVANRFEIDEINYQIKFNNETIKLHKSYGIPEIYLIGDVGFQGFEYKFDSNQDFWFLRLSLKWPIFSGFQNISRIQKSLLVNDRLEATLEEMHEKIFMQISEAYYGYKEALEVLNARREELHFSADSYKIAVKKYRQGLTLPIELYDARLKYTSARRKEIIARYNVKIKEAELEAVGNQTME